MEAAQDVLDSGPIQPFNEEEEEIRAFASQSDAFQFWENEEEDIYQDFLATT